MLDSGVVNATFVLPVDVVLAPVEELPRSVRTRFAHQPGDRILTWPRSRVPSSIVDEETAQLFERFRTPHTIAEAIVAHSSAEELDPVETLERAFPVLQKFINAGILIPQGSPPPEPAVSSCQDGEIVGGFEILLPVDVALDTEVYLARSGDGSFAALKVTRPSLGAVVESQFAREAAALRRLDGFVAPRLLAEGRANDRYFLSVAWFPGVDVFTASTRLRRQEEPAALRELVALAVSVAQAYASLHEHGLWHGDVHPRNALVDAGGVINLLDFGLAVLPEPSLDPRVPRRGVDFNTEPEVARALLDGRPTPQLTPAGEQYSVAALVYLLLTGSWTQQFSLEKREMLRQLAHGEPRAFAEHGITGLPAIEQVVRRSLALEEGLRFQSMRAFSEAVAAAAADDLSRDRRGSEHRRRRRSEPLLREALERVAVSGPLWTSGLEAPSCSVAYGAAGIAYALLRISMAREDGETLALADAWAQRGVAERATPDAFVSNAFEIKPETVGTASIFHSVAGTHCVDALIAAARDDLDSAAAALRAFVGASRRDRTGIDVSFGSSGNLLACVQLLEAFAPYSGWGEVERVRALGDELAADIADEDPRLGVENLGAAHGWAGIVYALLRWHESSGWPVPSWVRARLDKLAGLALPSGRGLRWPMALDSLGANRHSASSWCNGAAGFVYLWTLAERLLGDEVYGRLAERAAWTAWEAPDGVGDLCCGLAGRAFAVLNVFKQGGDKVWRRRAEDLAERAARSLERTPVPRRDSLYHGDLGVAVLAADLGRPEWSSMPLYEPEGLSRSARTADRPRARATRRA
jgi:eukaryotic-like serine/threonine-protein kinase